MELKLALFAGFLCIVFGVGLVIAGAAAYPLGHSVIDQMEQTASGYVEQGDSAVSSSVQLVASVQVSLEQIKGTVNGALPSLDSAAQDADSMVGVLDTLGATFESMGNSLAAITFANIAPFGEVGSSMRSVSTAIRQASTDLAGISASLEDVNQQAAEAPATLDSINAQLTELKISLTSIQGSVDEAKTTMPTYFAQAKLAVVGVVAAFAVFGAVFILSGIATLSMRSYITKKPKQNPP